MYTAKHEAIARYLKSIKNDADSSHNTTNLPLWTRSEVNFTPNIETWDADEDREFEAMLRELIKEQSILH